MKFNSVKFEISFFYTVILGIILSAFTVVLYVILVSTAYREIDYNLKFKAQEISSSLRSYIEMQNEKPESALQTAAQAIIAEEHRYLRWWWAMSSGSRWVKQASKIDIRQSYINLIGSDKKPLASSKNIPPDLMPLLLKNAQNLKGTEPTFHELFYYRRVIRIINYPFYYKDNNTYVIQVAIPRPAMAQQLQNWIYSLIFIIPVILMLASIAGWLVATRFLRPVEKIINMAQKISHEDLGQRVKEEEYAVEMKSLVEAFNAMIGRLQTSFKHIEEFSAHVAHELKTPLTIIRGETELALMRAHEPEEYKEVLRTIGQESERMLKTIEDLLYISKLDYQPQVFKFEQFDFVEFFGEIAEQSKILASPKKLRINFSLPSSPVILKADRLHLRRLFFNVLDNAIKFTPSNGQITVLARCEDDQLIVRVADTGKGISEKSLNKIFEKFFRDDAGGYGNGLGLSIVQTIAKAHSGTIAVQSKIKEGTTFTITLPLAKS